MDTLRTLAIILAIAAIGIGALLYASHDRPVTVDTWKVNLAEPIFIGSRDDRFAYAGGPTVRPVDGSGRLEFAGGRGSIRIRFTSPAEGSEWTGTIALRASLGGSDEIEREVMINGETGLGEPRLPETYAYIAGKSDFTLYSGFWRVARKVRGFWSLTHALRKEDGSIRNQGLVYSPLLRDKTVFSDPTRLEFTLILYGGDEVLLDLVFRGVTIVRSPPGEDLP